MIDYASKFIARHNEYPIMETYSQKYIFTCEQHTAKELKLAAKIVVKISYNNKQKLASDEIKKNIP